MITLDPSKIRDVDIYGSIKQQPYEYYVKWATEPPFYIMVEGAPQLVCTRMADTRAVLEDHARFSSVKRPYPGTQGFYFFNSMPSVTDSDPPTHTRRRRLMAPAFSPRKLVELEQSVAAQVDRVLDEVDAIDGPFDAVSDFAVPIAMHTLLGQVCDIPSEDWPIFTGLISAQRAAFSQLEGNAAEKHAYHAAWDRAWRYCEDAIARRRAAPTDDLVSNMIQAQERGSELTAEELFATLVILYSAGIGGLINYPAWTLWRLGRHPDQLALLRQDPALIAGTITESLRMDPSSYASLRYAAGDFEFEGAQVTEGMPVHTLSASGNYDPERFPDPLRFDITRPTDWKTLTSFGHGVHHCIGNGLARMVTRTAVARIVQRYPGLRLETPDFVPRVEGVLKQRAPVSVPMLLR
ncbi:cytochrome P450 [Rhizorhabdus dicambivorans]|uniref:cytochrome P450 n=1 Tax=Rhizorhabdus dicambivorans TaxID=1850238 RepID=UPI000AFAD674|nr:cytochrome P450 [Rhizorhabdus dicambivorans]